VEHLQRVGVELLEGQALAQAKHVPHRVEAPAPSGQDHVRGELQRRRGEGDGEDRGVDAKLLLVGDEVLGKDVHLQDHLGHGLDGGLVGDPGDRIPLEEGREFIAVGVGAEEAGEHALGQIERVPVDGARGEDEVEAKDAHRPECDGSQQGAILRWDVVPFGRQRARHEGPHGRHAGHVLT